MLQSASRENRRGYVLPALIPVMPPIERPQKAVVAILSAVEKVDDVVCEALQRIGASRRVGFPVAALIVADDAKAEADSLGRLPVPHVKIGAERIGKEQRRPVFASFDLVVDFCAVADRRLGHHFASNSLRAALSAASIICSALPR